MLCLVCLSMHGHLFPTTIAPSLICGTTCCIVAVYRHIIHSRVLESLTLAILQINSWIHYQWLPVLTRMGTAIYGLFVIGWLWLSVFFWPILKYNSAKKCTVWKANAVIIKCAMWGYFNIAKHFYTQMFFKLVLNLWLRHSFRTHWVSPELACPKQVSSEGFVAIEIYLAKRWATFVVPVNPNLTQSWPKLQYLLTPQTWFIVKGSGLRERCTIHTSSKTYDKLHNPICMLLYDLVRGIPLGTPPYLNVDNWVVFGWDVD